MTIKSFAKFFIPKSLKKRLAHQITLDRLDMLYFSQFGEDVILRRILKNFNDGFYIDIGSFHPTALSNTYYFYCKGWRGIAIEPNKDLVKLYPEWRPQDIVLQMGISERKQQLEYKLNINGPAENTFSNDFLSTHGNKTVGSYLVETDTLEAILDKYYKSNKDLIFFSVDAEGMSLQVLKSNNWSKYRPCVVVAEKLNTEEENIEMITFMEKNDYIVIIDIFHSLFFGKKECDKLVIQL